MKKKMETPVLKAEYEGKLYALWANGKWTHRPKGGERQEVTDENLITALEEMKSRYEARKAERAEWGKKAAAAIKAAQHIGSDRWFEKNYG